MNRSRRNFLGKTGTMVAGTMAASSLLPLEALADLRKKVGANDKINFGVIGCKGMGWSDMRSHLNMDEVECIALADVDQSVLDQRAVDVETARGKKPKLYKDYRKMLEDKDIDAVIIGTPDHWHCLTAVDSMEAGKQVYCEKPLANSIEECNVMMRAAKKNGSIVQIGQWQRSGDQYRDALAFLKSGKLGNIRLVKAWAYQGWMKSIPVLPNEPVPEGVDYEMWLGPAPQRPFNRNRFHFQFRWFWDYAGGLMTDWGVHEIDIALFGMDAVAPKSVMASGGKLAYPNDAAETPDTLQAVFEYDGYNMLWEHAVGIDGGNYGRTEGIAYIGNNGTLVVNRGGWEVIPETEKKGDQTVEKVEKVPFRERQIRALDAHTQNFVEAMKANDPTKLNCPIESGAIAAINAHMGNIAYKTGRKIYWDQEKGAFKNDREANQLLKPEYLNGWRFPQV